MRFLRLERKGENSRDNNPKEHFEFTKIVLNHHQCFLPRYSSSCRFLAFSIFLKQSTFKFGSIRMIQPFFFWDGDFDQSLIFCESCQLFLFWVFCFCFDHWKNNDGVFFNSSYHHCVAVTLVYLFLESIPRLFLFPRSHLSLPGTCFFLSLMLWFCSELV